MRSERLFAQTYLCDVVQVHDLRSYSGAVADQFHHFIVGRTVSMVNTVRSDSPYAMAILACAKAPLRRCGRPRFGCR
jgi:hypothetical protein